MTVLLSLAAGFAAGWASRAARQRRRDATVLTVVRYMGLAGGPPAVRPRPPLFDQDVD